MGRSRFEQAQDIIKSVAHNPHRSKSQYLRISRMLNQVGTDLFNDLLSSNLIERKNFRSYRVTEKGRVWCCDFLKLSRELNGKERL